jgi:hypothetical protein
MPKSWRWIAPIAVAGGLIASGTVPAAEASPAAAASITINATSPHYGGNVNGEVDGHALVIYKAAKKANAATISGNVTPSATGASDTAQLMAEPFGTTKYKAVGSPVALIPGSNGVAPYSFTVKPSLATHYKVKVAGTDTAVSNAVTVYVTAGALVPSKYVHVKCNTSLTRCVISVREYTILPASAYRTESGKHVYLYMAIGDPTLPKNSTLSKSATASKAKRVNSGEFWRTLTWTIRGHFNANTVPDPNACTKDTESKDGMGLPGHHGCGNKRVLTRAIYLG